MTRFLRNLFTRPFRPTVRRPIRRPGLGIESLETREVPATITLSNGIVAITGDAGNNVATVSQVGNQIVAKVDAVQQSYAVASVQQVNFSGGDGNDTFTSTVAVTCVASGDNGDDSLVGGGGNDLLSGGAGNDSLEGRGGNDFLVGGAGDDTYVFSGVNLGADTVIEAAGNGTDTLDFSKFGPAFFAIGSPPPGVMVDIGSTSKQIVSGSDLSLTLTDAGGIENVNGSAFADTVWGNALGNVIHGNGGNDRLFGKAGNDVVYGDAGDDDVHGGDGNDIVCGGVGNDRVYGEAGTNWVYGGTGDDQLYGGTGQNYLYGEDGNDTLVSVNGAGGDQITGGLGNDTSWIDPGDFVLDAGAADHVHMVNSFLSYNIPNGQGGFSTVPVNATPNSPNLADPVNDVAAVSNATLANFSGTPLFSGTPQATDIRQGATGDCYFLSKLAALAKTNPAAVKQLVTEMGDGTYIVNFHDKFGGDVFVRVDGDLWTDGNMFNPQPVYAGLGNGSLWVPIVEKAYAFYCNNRGSYWSIYGGNSPTLDPIVALGFTPEYHQWDQWPNATNASYDFSNGVSFLNAIKADLAAGKAVTIGGPANWQQNPNGYHNGTHIYMADAVLTDANGNPTGIRVYDLYGSYQTIMGPALVFHESVGFWSFVV